MPLLQYLNAWWKFPSWSLNKSETASLRPSKATLLRYLIQISVRCSTMLSRKSIHFRSHFYQQLHVMASSYTFAGFLGRRRFLSFFVDIKSKFLGSWHVDLIRVDHFETNHLETNLYSSLPNKRSCTPYLIFTKLPPCTLLFGTASLSIFLNF